MKLPNRDKAYIPPSKLYHYLLSLTHSAGHTKAKFFRSIGFNETNIRFLEAELLSIARARDVLYEITTPFGVKYVINGSLHAPDGIIVNVRTVWIIEHDEDQPRFVTAYPGDKQKKR